MTEDEAKKKWCPFVRSSVVGANKNDKLICISNRDAAQLAEVGDIHTMTHNCIGSACMAWRGRQELHETSRNFNEIQTHGHCGLAGKP